MFLAELVWWPRNAVLVYDIAYDRMQQRLLSEPYSDLDVKRVVYNCLVQKIASQRSQESQLMQPTVNTVSQFKGKPQGLQARQERGERVCCLSCGDPTHHSDNGHCK